MGMRHFISRSHMRATRLPTVALGLFFVVTIPRRVLLPASRATGASGRSRRGGTGLRARRRRLRQRRGTLLAATALGQTATIQGASHMYEGQEALVAQTLANWVHEVVLAGKDDR